LLSSSTTATILTLKTGSVKGNLKKF